jgi:hypothetical protein
MSAGGFVTGRYEDNSGNVWRVRVQPESAGLTLGGEANDFPAGTPTAGLPTLKQKLLSRRGLGLTMRSVQVEFTADGTGATGDYLGTGTRHNIPVFDPAVWDAYDNGQTGTYLGVACVFVNKSPEVIR